MPRGISTQVLGGFKTGMDRQTKRGGKDGAQRLWTLENAYLNERGDAVPRPGLQHVANVAHSAGLYGWQGQLHVFHGESDYVDPGNPLVTAHWIRYPLPPPAALAMTGALSDGVPGDAVSYQYTISGGVPPYIVSIASGGLPSGISINASGLATGIYTTVGSYAWTVRVVDADGTIVDLPNSITVHAGSLIGLLTFDADMPTDATGRVWTVKYWTEQIGYAPKLTWPQWDGSTYLAGPGSFRMSRAGTTLSAEQGFYYGQARMYSALGAAAAIDGATDFCIEGHVRRDPGDDNGGGNTMFLDFGIQLWARVSATPRVVSLETLPATMVATYDGTVDRTIPTDRFIHFALTRQGSTLTFWWGGKAAATVSNASLLVLSSTFPVSLGTSQSSYAAYQMPGWLDEIRITRGYARYTTNFTPPTTGWLH